MGVLDAGLSNLPVGVAGMEESGRPPAPGPPPPAGIQGGTWLKSWVWIGVTAGERIRVSGTTY